MLKCVNRHSKQKKLSKMVRQLLEAVLDLYNGLIDEENTVQPKKCRSSIFANLLK